MKTKQINVLIHTKNPDDTHIAASLLSCAVSTNLGHAQFPLNYHDKNDTVVG